MSQDRIAVPFRTTKGMDRQLSDGEVITYQAECPFCSQTNTFKEWSNRGQSFFKNDKCDHWIAIKFLDKLTIFRQR